MIEILVDEQEILLVIVKYKSITCITLRYNDHHNYRNGEILTFTISNFESRSLHHCFLYKFAQGNTVLHAPYQSIEKFLQIKSFLL